MLLLLERREKVLAMERKKERGEEGGRKKDNNEQKVRKEGRVYRERGGMYCVKDGRVSDPPSSLSSVYVQARARESFGRRSVQTLLPRRRAVAQRVQVQRRDRGGDNG